MDREDQELGMVWGRPLPTLCACIDPRSAIEVVVTVIEDNRSVIAATITTVGEALADTDIRMFDIVVGSRGSLPRKEVVVDLDRNELEWDGGGLEQVVACMCESVMQT